MFNGKELDRETNLSYYGARYLDMKTSLWLSVDPLAEKMSNYGAYVYTFNNPIRFTDPTGMIAEPPVGVDAEDGATHSDSSGSWKYEKATTTWKGQNGARDIGNTIELDNVNIKGYKSDYVPSGDYGPYVPDAVGVNLTVSVNTGLFGSFGVNVGGAIDVYNNAEGFVGGYMDIGYNGSFSIPKLNFGASLDLHDSYIGNNSSVAANSIPGGVLGNLGGVNQTYNGGLGLTGGYSYSLDSNTQQKADFGVETKSIGLGFGINAQGGRAKSWTFTEIYNKITNEK